MTVTCISTDSLILQEVLQGRHSIPTVQMGKLSLGELRSSPKSIKLKNGLSQDSTATLLRTVKLAYSGHLLNQNVSLSISLSVKCG